MACSGRLNPGIGDAPWARHQFKATCAIEVPRVAAISLITERKSSLAGSKRRNNLDRSLVEEGDGFLVESPKRQEPKGYRPITQRQAPSKSQLVHDERPDQERAVRVGLEGSAEESLCSIDAYARNEDVWDRRWRGRALQPVLAQSNLQAHPAKATLARGITSRAPVQLDAIQMTT